MNSVQENKNELEAAVRYCESAISRAQATIESMEFRQQAATKAWHEQTGREAALEREVARLRAINAERETMLEERKNQLVEWRDRSAGYTKEIGELKDEIAELEQSEHDLKFQYNEAKTNMALMTDELEELRGIIDRMGDDSTGDSVTIKQLEERNGELKSEVEEYAKKNNELHHKQQEMEQTMQLQKDQIAMFQRKMSRLNEVAR